MDLNAELSKSLNELDSFIDAHTKEEEISKAQADEDLSAGDVSEDAPEEGNPEEGQQAPEEDAPEDTQSEDTDEDSEPEENEQEDEEVEKSMASDLSANESTKKALEVSEFLSELVKSLDVVLNERTDGLRKSIESKHTESNNLLAKSIIGIAKGQRALLEDNAELLKSVRLMNKRMEELERQPVVRKSVANTTQVVEKSFNASAGIQAPKQALTKSQASAKLMSAYDSGNQEVLNDILALEGTGNLDAISDAGKQVLGLLQ